MRRLILHSRLSPGDILTLTAAIESLHQSYPKEYQTDVRTPCSEIWQNNPHITSIPDTDTNAQHIQMEYPQIHKSDERPFTFITAYAQFLQVELKLPTFKFVNRPYLYLTDNEKNWVPQVQETIGSGKPIKYWVLNAGIKKDYTAKQWPLEYYERVVTETFGQIQWVQIGSTEHEHHHIHGTLDLRGKTNHRQLMRLVYHSQGGLGPVTYLQHLCAAFEKPYLCLLGGREPVLWTAYPKQHTFHTVGTMSCCYNGACWKSRVVKLDDGADSDKSLCEYPLVGFALPVAKCMAEITPKEVIQKLRRIALC